ncbi:MAG: hypothetical protein R3B70_03070 [Polyangiaceae bacterium]
MGRAEVGSRDGESRQGVGCPSRRGDGLGFGALVCGGGGGGPAAAASTVGAGSAAAAFFSMATASDSRVSAVLPRVSALVMSAVLPTLRPKAAQDWPMPTMVSTKVLTEVDLSLHGAD